MASGVCSYHRTKNEEKVNWLPHQEHSKETADLKHSQYICEIGLLAYLHSCDLRGRILIKHTSRGWQSSPEMGRQAGAIFMFFLCPTPVSPWKKLAPHILSATQELVSCGACVHGFNGMIAKKQFLNDYHPRCNCRENAQKHSSANLPERYTCIFQKLLPMGTVSNEPESKCWLRFFALEHWQVLAYPQLLGTTKN